nr:hypothetical protein [Kofleriaceae bacterium]
MRVVVLTLLAAGCGAAHPAATNPPGADAASQPASDAAGTRSSDGGAASDAAPAAACADVDDSAPLAVATATAADDYALTLTATSASATSWGQPGNEALVLEVAGAQRGFIGHLILHHGAAPFDYTMHLGALAAGEQLTVRVSTLSAQQAVRQACVSAALTAVSTLGAAADGVRHAPIYRWPVQKAFDDVPLVVGWSKAKQMYQGVMTNEDGGTTEQCGGGASGMQAEIARWGRASDIEGHYFYKGATPSWERCTGTVPVTTTALRMEADHPVLYYGDGHNRLFESRGGYGQTCGTGSPEKPYDIAGWSSANPGSSLADDAGLVVVLRPLPYDLDALGYAQFGGRREGLADHYAPWLYRLSALEIAKEGKVDGSKVLAMARYLYVDVRVADVGGSGDAYCATLGVSGGFKVRAFTASGTQIDGPQITSDYASSGAHDWKRVAIPLPAGVTAADIDHFAFDAYDGDGIYLTALGDAFVAEPDGDNGAKLSYVRQGETDYTYYVDDDNSSCSNGVNTGGPGGVAYTCKGSSVTLAK